MEPMYYIGGYQRPLRWPRTVAPRDAAISRRLFPAANPAFSSFFPARQEPMSLGRLRQNSDAAKLKHGRGRASFSSHKLPY
jgi:hypothetical protein